ncbi:MAG: zinc-finger-containing protein [Geminicoccaceae bacterium]
MTATCLHCGGDCGLTEGVEIYPHRPDLADKQIWKCDPCQATVGCHPGTLNPLGHAADEPTRKARSNLHDLRLDLIWKSQPDKPAQQCHAPAGHLFHS